MQIRDNVFMVTGGSSGLGAATARMIVERGGRVVLADVNQGSGVAFAAELGASARFVVTDVTSDESAKNAFAAATEMGCLRGLVNCAGIAPAEKLLGREGIHRLDTFARTINIKLILWTGQTDWKITANNATNYYRSVVQTNGGQAAADEFVEYYTAPGVDHCEGARERTRSIWPGPCSNGWKKAPSHPPPRSSQRSAP